MSLTIEIAPTQEQPLQRQSEETGKPISAVLVEIIDSLPNAKPKEKQGWGAAIWAELEEEGFSPIWQDRSESSRTLARRFKEKAEGRSGNE